MSDLISREAAIDAAVKMFEVWYGGSTKRNVEIRARFDALPSAQERKKGEWEEKEVIHKDEAKKFIEEWQSCRCSECGLYDARPYMYYFREPNYCSFCGAYMREGGRQWRTDK